MAKKTLEDLRRERDTARRNGNTELVNSLSDKVEMCISEMMRGKRGIDIEESAGPEEG